MSTLVVLKENNTLILGTDQVLKFHEEILCQQ